MVKRHAAPDWWREASPAIARGEMIRCARTVTAMPKAFAVSGSKCTDPDERGRPLPSGPSPGGKRPRRAEWPSYRQQTQGLNDTHQETGARNQALREGTLPTLTRCSSISVMDVPMRTEGERVVEARRRGLLGRPMPLVLFLSTGLTIGLFVLIYAIS